MTGQEIATQQQRSPAQQLVAQVRDPQFMAQVELAVPPDVTADRFIRITATVLLQNPDIAQCETPSILNSLLRCAQDGLVPDGREAALVKYGSKANYIPMIGGYRKRAAEHGWVLHTKVVYANDEFEHEEGLDQKLRHIPVRPGAERGEIIAAYCIATHRDGRRDFVVIDSTDIARYRAKAQTDRVWKEHPAAMTEKTAGRRMFEKLWLAENDRIKHMLEAEDIVEATELMYGHEPQGALAAGTSEPAEPTDTGAEAAGDQQADAAPATSPQGAASAPDDEDDPEPIPGGSQVDAGEVVVPSAGNNAYAGKTIGEVHAAGDDGILWFEWALKPNRVWNKTDSPEELRVFGSALATYIDEHLPELTRGRAA